MNNGIRSWVLLKSAGPGWRSDYSQCSAGSQLRSLKALCIVVKAAFVEGSEYGGCKDEIFTVTSWLEVPW